MIYLMIVLAGYLPGTTDIVNAPMHSIQECRARQAELVLRADWQVIGSVCVVNK